jgi:hypothetical protein
MVARLELEYAPELSTLSEPERCRRLVTLDILTDFESWGRLREVTAFRSKRRAMYG